MYMLEKIDRPIAIVLVTALILLGVMGFTYYKLEKRIDTLEQKVTLNEENFAKLVDFLNKLLQQDQQ